MNRQRLVISATIGTGLLMAVLGAFSLSMSTAQEQGQQEGPNGALNNATFSPADNNQKPSFLYALTKKHFNYENGVLTVKAGIGGHIAPLTYFFPKNTEIKVGEKVTWINPTQVGEPHTVSFIRDPRYFADFGSPFMITNTTQLVALQPGANVEPVIMPGPNGTSVLVAVNKRSFAPTVIAEDGNVSYLEPNAEYTMDDTEKYINSGWIWPKDQAPPGFAPINTFSVTFTKAGTYDYICLVHPWMTGKVAVN
jgi:plastocyanin